MSPRFKLAVDNKVEIPVKFTLKAGKVNKDFKFALMGMRLEQEVITSTLEAVGYVFKDFLLSRFETDANGKMKRVADGTMGADGEPKGEPLIYGWEGQRFVLDENEKPVEFSVEAFDHMLSQPSVAQVIYGQYHRECGAKEKN